MRELQNQTQCLDANTVLFLTCCTDSTEIRSLTWLPSTSADLKRLSAFLFLKHTSPDQLDQYQLHCENFSVRSRDLPLFCQLKRHHLWCYVPLRLGWSKEWRKQPAHIYNIWANLFVSAIGMSSWHLHLAFEPIKLEYCWSIYDISKWPYHIFTKNV